MDFTGLLPNGQHWRWTGNTLSESHYYGFSVDATPELDAVVDGACCYKK
jgi:hypothetical protein